MTSDAVLYDERDRIVYITLNRPEKRNAFGKEVAHDMRAAFQKIAADGEIRAAVLTGSGTSFCAGADVADPETHATASVLEYLDGGPIWDYFPSLKIPIIAAVNGYCFGAGLELAFCCDIVIASDRAQFGLQHIRWGLYPAGGGAGRLAAIAGKPQAMYYVLTGERFDAQQALAMGVASKVVPHDQLMESVEETARTIAQFSPLVARYAKESIYEAVEQPLRQLAQTDRFRNFTLYSTGDREEGHKAFIEKRDPSYKGD
jgi:enoyl-CoA hydratase